MQRKKYYQWIAIASSAIIVVVILFITVLQARKNQANQNATATPTPTASPTTSPTLSPSPTSNVTPTSTTTSSPGANHKALAEEAYKNKNYAVAISEYLQAIEGTTTAATLATLWNELGNVYRDNQNATEALKAYDKSLSYNNKLGDAYLNKAALLWSQGKKAEARATLQTGIDIGASRKGELQNTLSVYEIEE